jgi:hypothetical protein
MEWVYFVYFFTSKSLNGLILFVFSFSTAKKLMEFSKILVDFFF